MVPPKLKICVNLAQYEEKVQKRSNSIIKYPFLYKTSIWKRRSFLPSYELSRCSLFGWKTLLVLCPDGVLSLRSPCTMVNTPDRCRYRQCQVRISVCYFGFDFRSVQKSERSETCRNRSDPRVHVNINTFTCLVHVVLYYV